MVRGAGKLMRCAKCRAELTATSGPGRPPTFCSEVCRRLVEAELRRLDRRVGAYEVEAREVRARGRGFEHLDDDERAARLRVLRAWVKQDTERMRVLLAGGRDA